MLHDKHVQRFDDSTESAKGMLESCRHAPLAVLGSSCLANSGTPVAIWTCCPADPPDCCFLEHITDQVQGADALESSQCVPEQYLQTAKWIVDGSGVKAHATNRLVDLPRSSTLKLANQ